MRLKINVVFFVIFQIVTRLYNLAQSYSWLQETERVILMHHLDSSVYKQVVGQEEQLGRTRPLEVVSLLYPGEEVGQS